MATGCIFFERPNADCHVVVTGVAHKGINAIGCVVVAVAVRECSMADGRVPEAGRVALEGIHTDGRVLVAGGVQRERVLAEGVVEATSGICNERISTDGRVLDAGGVGRERSSADGRVVATGVAGQREISKRRIGVTKIADLWTLRAGGWYKHEQCERSNNSSKCFNGRVVVFICTEPCKNLARLSSRLSKALVVSAAVSCDAKRCTRTTFARAKISVALILFPTSCPLVGYGMPRRMPSLMQSGTPNITAAHMMP